VWELQDLKAMFQRLAKETVLETRFCFFIDGLDEYNGEEEELVQILKFISSSPHIKICVSGRPRSIFEDFFNDHRYKLIISEHTRGDMESYVRRQLQENQHFQRLEGSESACEEIVEMISKQAQGVWLWVFLVTRDLIHAVNRNEGLGMLRKITAHFPPDLQSYFERIINGIKPTFREEMAQIFLIAVDELQPLPLFAFSLLERERADKDYALNAPIKPISNEDLSEDYPKWKSRIQNRCGDLLVVEDGPHPIFLDHPVDFLHRTVRDFLQDCYYQQLRQNLDPYFSPVASLSKMCLFFLKSLPVSNFRDKDTVNTIVGLTDELLYYAHEYEKRSEEPYATLTQILDTADQVNSGHARRERNHWVYARDMPLPRGSDQYREGDSYTFLALTVQARLVKYVRGKLQANPNNINKKGRPLLDYALRPRRRTPITMPYHSQRDDPSVDVVMVKMLLEHGADPNQAVHLNGGQTVWALFLISCYESLAKQAHGQNTRSARKPEECLVPSLRAAH
jgi:hypothetical protein